MASDRSPLWRRVFDDVERRVGRPLEAATTSTEFQSAALKLRQAKRVVATPVQSLTGLGLRLVGLPSPAEVRNLKRQLGEVQREVLAMRREKAQAERDEQAQQ